MVLSQLPSLPPWAVEGLTYVVLCSHEISKTMEEV